MREVRELLLCRGDMGGRGPDARGEDEGEGDETVLPRSLGGDPATLGLRW